jgi:hypothetical protein
MSRSNTGTSWKIGFKEQCFEQSSTACASSPSCKQGNIISQSSGWPSVPNVPQQSLSVINSLAWDLHQQISRLHPNCHPQMFTGSSKLSREQLHPASSVWPRIHAHPPHRSRFHCRIVQDIQPQQRTFVLSFSWIAQQWR